MRTCGRCGRELVSGELAYFRAHVMVCASCRPSPGRPKKPKRATDALLLIRATTAAWAAPDRVLADDSEPTAAHKRLAEVYDVATPAERELLETIAGTTATTVAQASRLLGIDEQAAEKRRQRLVRRAEAHSAAQSGKADVRSTGVFTGRLGGPCDG